MEERAVQTFKSGMQKLKEGSYETKVAHFLFTYRITPQSSTGVSPSELMFRCRSGQKGPSEPGKTETRKR